MNPKLRRLFSVIGLILIGILIGVGTMLGSLFISMPADSTAPRPALTEVSPATASSGEGLSQTVELLAADAFDDALNASGNIELIETRQVVQKISGDVEAVAINVGDHVNEGDLILTLDTVDLKRALDKADVEVELARLELAKVVNEASSAELALAKANLLSAEENLLKVSAGATKEELAASQSNNAATWAKYQDLLAGSSSEKINSAKAALRKAEVDLQEAQRNYDAVAWQNDVGMTAEAAALQKATIEYERLQAEFEDASKPTTEADRQAALSQAQKAQDDLNRLKLKPTAGEIADAEAKVAEAKAKIAKLQSGAERLNWQSAELRVKKALIDLDEAQANLHNATVTAPIEGVILEIKIKAGDRGTAGSVVATIGNTKKLQLTINVAEADIGQIHIGQSAQITLDALPDQTLTGTVTQIAPLSQTKREVISYPVIIQLTDQQLDSVFSGMTAVATLEKAKFAADTWLVPTNALQQQEDATVVMVVRNGKTTPISVTTGPARGEWTQVQSPELQQGDKVIGTVSSFVDQQQGVPFGN